MRNTYQSILPEFDVFTPGPPVRHPPPGGQMLGAVHRPRRSRFAAISPAVSLLSGLGQEPVTPGQALPPVQPTEAEEKPSLAVALTVIGIVGALSYQVGKAMTPSGSKATTWGLIAAPVGLFTGPIGLGVMAIVANQSGR